MQDNELEFENPVLWAQEEFKRDLEYWRDRAKNGTGLIQQIAEFILSLGQSER